LTSTFELNHWRVSGGWIAETSGDWIGAKTAASQPGVMAAMVHSWNLICPQPHPFRLDLRQPLIGGAQKLLA
jgi:hypothetical protein